MLKQVITGVTGLLCGMLLVLGFTQASITQAQSDSCILTNNEESLLVFFAPIYTGSQLKDILPEGETYTLLAYAESFFLIEYGDGEQGWIEFHTRLSNGTCSEIYDHPPVNDPNSDFPTVCMVTTTIDHIYYEDSDLTEEDGVLTPRLYTVDSIDGNVVMLASSYIMNGGYFESTAQDIFSGHCHGTLQTAFTLDNAQVWSQPDATIGDPMLTLPPHTTVGITNGPITGSVQVDQVGDWYQIIKGETIGWIDADQVRLGRTYTATQPAITIAMVTTQDAQLWSEPNITTGKRITVMGNESRVRIIGEVMTDSDQDSTWYPIQQGGTTGWILADHLMLFNEN